MTQELRDLLNEQAKAILEAGSACQEIKEAAQNWLDAAGTDKEEAAKDALVAEAKEDITTIEDLIALAESDMGKQIFGEEGAAATAAAAKEAKANGAKYCICPACAACEKIIEKFA